MTAPQDEAARIRGYLVAQANKLSLPELIEKVRKDTLPLRDLADVIPPEQLHIAPKEGEWSAAEVWTHILEMNEHGARAIVGILDSGAVPERARDQISGATREGFSAGEQYYGAWLARREELLERVSRATGDEHLDIVINHAIFGGLSWREWLLFMRIHDLDHLRQLQGIAQALGIEGA